MSERQKAADGPVEIRALCAGTFTHTFAFPPGGAAVADRHTYELWSAASGNRIASLDSLQKLGEAVRSILDAEGQEAIHDLFAEVWVEGADQPSGSLSGDDLLNLEAGNG